MSSKLNTSSIDIEVGKQLLKLRKRFDLSQSQLGETLNVSYQQVQRYEKGKSRLGAHGILKLSKAFSIPSSYFFETLPDNSKMRDKSLMCNSVPESELIEIISSFLRIKNPDFRRALLDLARDYGTDETQSVS